MTPLTQVILANCECLAFSRSVAVRATWAATFLGFINARPPGRHSMSMLTFVAE